MHQFALTVQASHTSQAIFEMAPVSLGQIFQLVFRHIQAASSNFMQQRFPDVGSLCVNQRDLGKALLPEFSAEARDEFQSCSATSYNNDFMLFRHDAISYE
jgi:hypothetical protein